MKNRRSVEVILRNLELISEGELSRLWLAVNDEVKRRFRVNRNFRDKYRAGLLEEAMVERMRKGNDEFTSD
jgi:hypothetical protein